MGKNVRPFTAHTSGVALFVHVDRLYVWRRRGRWGPCFCGALASSVGTNGLVRKKIVLSRKASTRPRVAKSPRDRGVCVCERERDRGKMGGWGRPGARRPALLFAQQHHPLPPPWLFSCSARSMASTRQLWIEKRDRGDASISR